MSSWFDEASKWLEDEWHSFTDVVSTLYNDGKHAISSVFNTADNAISSVENTVHDSAVGVVGVANNVVNQSSSTIRSLGNNVTDSVKTVADDLPKLLSSPGVLMMGGLAAILLLKK